MKRRADRARWRHSLGRHAVGLVVLLSLLAVPLASAEGEPVLRYPDLQTLPPSELTPDTIGFGPLTRHVLRFTNTVVNAGDGPLELRGDPASGQLVQRLYAENGDVVDRPLPGASFIFHPDHGHWHLSDFAQYELQRLDEPTGRRHTKHRTGARHTHQRHQQRHKRHGHRHSRGHRTHPGTRWYPVHAGRSKASFCVRDSDRLRDEAATPAEPVYTTCEQDIQGLSVGWGDTYRFGIADQWIDVGDTPLPDGRYLLRSVADPSNLLDEGGNESEASNAAQTCFTITGALVQLAAC